MPILAINASIETLPTINEYLLQNIGDEFQAVLPYVQVATEEIIVNIYSYAYLDHNSPIEINLHPIFFCNENLMYLSIKDWGKPFDIFKDAAEPDLTSDLSERQIGGLGIHLVKSLTRHYAYSRNNGANFVELYFSKE